MVFASPVFLFWFLPLALLLYFASPRPLRTPMLTGLSVVVFYGWWRLSYAALMLLSSLIDFVLGGLIGRTEAPRRRKLLLVASIVLNLGLLGWFKYADFGIRSLNAVLAAAGHEAIPLLGIVLPVGISFFTFQSMSYTIDVYRREVEPIRSFTSFFCYVSLFPQLVAGPIVRFRDVADQLRERRHSLGAFATGALLFEMGLAKKVLLADSVAPLANQAYALADPSLAEAWLGTAAYAFQIYFDFSGYSDMAIGLGLLLGFRFPINFDSPYRSRSITEFWRRWHISLSTWLRDYLYIPLGGNRHGRARTVAALLGTMLLGGLWHGAAWTFVAWGAYQGLWLVFERALGKRTLYAKAPVPVQVALTFVIALGGWVFFRAGDMDQAFAMLAAMAGLSSSPPDLLRIEVGRMALTAFAAAAFLAFAVRPSHEHAARASRLAVALVPVAFLIAATHLLFQSYRPFLYFQF